MNNNSTYRRLGDYIREVDVRNTSELLSENDLYGVSVTKEFITTHANLVGVRFNNYKIVKKGQFTYISDTSRRGEKIALAYNSLGKEIIVSSAYSVFEIIDHNILMPEYLMMWFRRTEFDRYARFHSHGSAREVFEWEEMCNVMLPVPPIEEQRSVVNRYKAIENRIANNKQTIAKLEEAAQALYRKMFVDGIDVNNLPEGWRMGCLGEVAEIKGGKRLPSDSTLSKYRSNHPYIKIADMKDVRYLSLNNNFEYISDESTFKQISRYIVNTDDILLSIVGTIGIVTIVDKSLDGANQTENCVKITDLKSLSAYYIYQYLVSNKGQTNIEQATVGAVQKKLPIYNIQSLSLLIPDIVTLEYFDDKMKPIADFIKELTIEQNKLTEMLSVVMA